MVKRLLIEGGDINKKNNRTETPYDYSIKYNIDKIKNIFDDFIKEKSNKICIVRPGLRKPEKSSFNLYCFIILHVFFESIIFFLILPCKFIIFLISLNKVYNSYTITYLFLGLLIMIGVVFAYLTISNPGFNSVQLETPLKVFFLFIKLYILLKC